MKKTLITLTFGMLMLMLAGCGLEQASTPTPTAVDGALNGAVALIQQDMYLRLTQQVIDNQRIEAGARMTATQQVLDVTATVARQGELAEQTRVAHEATKQVWDVTVAAGQAFDTATAQAAAAGTAQANLQATATLEAQATKNQLAVLAVTATVEAERTATSEQKTQQAPFEEARRKAVEAQAESAELAASRERMTNGVIAWGPWVIALVALAVAAYTIIIKSRIGTIERDQNGLMPGVMILHNGKKMFISPDRMFGPTLVMDQTGISAPQLVDPDRQEGATRRAQAVEAINALPPQQQRQGLNLMNQTFNQATRPRVEILEAGQVSGWVDEAETKLNEEL